VIGAGISGLACAFRLRQLGIPVLILEASAKAGGVISTVRRNGFLFEGGPQCPRFPKSVWTLIRELGLQEEFIAGDSRAKRYILRNGELHQAPFSAGGLLTTTLVGFKSKYSLLSEVFRRSDPPAREESLAEFVDRKLARKSWIIWLTHLFPRSFLVIHTKWACTARFPHSSNGSEATAA
jgi:oxygen-dependent protoporphyrinogen oxidase